MEMLILALAIPALMVVSILSAIFVYYDTVSHNISKVSGSRDFTNLSSFGWAITMLFFWIVAFPTYLIKRKSLIEQGRHEPLQDSMFGLKAGFFGLFVYFGVPVIYSIGISYLSPSLASAAVKSPPFMCNQNNEFENWTMEPIEAMPVMHDQNQENLPENEVELTTLENTDTKSPNSLMTSVKNTVANAVAKTGVSVNSNTKSPAGTNLSDEGLSEDDLRVLGNMIRKDLNRELRFQGPKTAGTSSEPITCSIVTFESKSKTRYTGSAILSDNSQIPIEVNVQGNHIIWRRIQ